MFVIDRPVALTMPMLSMTIWISQPLNWLMPCTNIWIVKVVPTAWALMLTGLTAMMPDPAELAGSNTTVETIIEAKTKRSNFLRRLELILLLEVKRLSWQRHLR